VGVMEDTLMSKEEAREQVGCQREVNWNALASTARLRG
jgi:hypothetical protein